MVFGHNTNLNLGAVTFHVQTEDRGEAHALIDTTVYYRGRVLHRRTNNYFDLLPLNEDREEALRLRLDEQHRTVMEEIRRGVLQLAIPQEGGAGAAGKLIPGGDEAGERGKLVLELANAKTWLSGKHARLQIVVRDAGGEPARGATVKVEFEGGEGNEVFVGRTDPQGLTLVEFDLPRITNAEAAMLISAENEGGKGHLRFAMRAKPRVGAG